MKHGLQTGCTYLLNWWRVIDGDTVEISVAAEADPSPKHYIRLAGIDAPEMDASLGPASAHELARAFNQAEEMLVFVTPIPDRYGRAVGIMQEPNAACSVNEWLVRNGMAETSHVSQYADYREAQTLAQQDGVGIWEPMVPRPPASYMPQPLVSRTPQPSQSQSEGDLLSIIDWICAHKFASAAILIFSLLVIRVGFCT